MALLSTLAIRHSTSAAEESPPLLVDPTDTVLFVGDDITQQMYYTRAVATALLGVLPENSLRFFNGGRDGATAGEAVKWIDDLMELSRPTLVTVLLGINDAEAETDADKAVAAYRGHLAALVEKIRGHVGVRRVVLLSPPPLQSGVGPDAALLGLNLTLARIAQSTREVAQETGCDFLDLFDYMRTVYDSSNQSGGAPLTFGGKLPTEEGHMVLASMLLWGLGVDEKRIEPVGWSPILPVKMRKVRQVLAFRVGSPTLEQAQSSRTLYESMRRHDEYFFRAWRIAGRKPSGPSREDLLSEARKQWTAVRELAARTYGLPASRTQP